MPFIPPIQFPKPPKSDDLSSADFNNPKVKKYTEKYHRQAAPLTTETLCQRKEAMRKVLLHIQAKKPFDDLSFEERRIFKECYDRGYFEGVVPSEMISGRVAAEYRHDPRLALEGLQFLESLNESEKSAADNDQECNSTVKKAFNVVKACIKRFWILLCGLSVLVTILGWPLILRLLSFLTSLF